MILILVLIFISVCLLIFVFFTFTNNNSNIKDNSSSNETLSTTLTLTRDKSYILQHLESLKKLIEEKFNRVDFMSDQSMILSTIGDLESKVKSLLHEPITNFNTVKYSLVNLQQDIANILSIIKLYPTQELKEFCIQVKNIQTELKTLIGKQQVSVGDVVENFQNIVTNIKNEIIEHIPENKINSFEDEFRKIRETSTERNTQVLNIISTLESQGQVLQSMVPILNRLATQ